MRIISGHNDGKQYFGKTQEEGSMLLIPRARREGPIRFCFSEKNPVRARPPCAFGPHWDLPVRLDFCAGVGFLFRYKAVLCPLLFVARSLVAQGTSCGAQGTMGHLPEKPPLCRYRKVFVCISGVALPPGVGEALPDRHPGASAVLCLIDAPPL